MKTSSKLCNTNAVLVDGFNLIYKFPGLEEKIRVCNSTYTVRFGVRLRGKIETFTGYRSVHSEHMEPVKGGTLANPPARVKDILTAADKDASPASWAIRFAASLDDVAVVLSGMSSMAQMEDNLSYMRHFAPLTQDERATLAKAQQALSAVDTIPCTACRYCMAGCP